VRAASLLRYTGAMIVGIALGLGAAWAITGQGLRGGDITNGIWTTSLGYGVKATDPITRAAVARDGLLALPAAETVYWAARSDADGRPLEGNCRYTLSGPQLRARWWSVTIYDTRGYLMEGAAPIWSVNGANVPVDASGRWTVQISPDRPASGGWLPSDPAQPFHLTLRMCNPDKSFMAAPDRAALPTVTRAGCA
jgi:hypothetical protein